MKAYSTDLRDRIVTAVDRGQSVDEAAECYNVAPAPSGASSSYGENRVAWNPDPAKAETPYSPQSNSKPSSSSAVTTPT